MQCHHVVLDCWKLCAAVLDLLFSSFWHCSSHARLRHLRPATLMIVARFLCLLIMFCDLARANCPRRFVRCGATFSRLATVLPAFPAVRWRVVPRAEHHVLFLMVLHAIRVFASLGESPSVSPACSWPTHLYPLLIAGGLRPAITDWVWSFYKIGRRRRTATAVHALHHRLLRRLSFWTSTSMVFC